MTRFLLEPAVGYDARLRVAGSGPSGVGYCSRSCQLSAISYQPDCRLPIADRHRRLSITDRPSPIADSLIASPTSVPGPQTSKLPPSLGRPPHFVLGQLHADGGDPVARVAAGSRRPPPDRARHGWPGARGADRRVLAHQRSRGRRTRSSKAHAGDAVHHGRARDDSVPGDVSRTVGDVADLCAGRNELRGRRIRFAGAAVAPAEPGALAKIFPTRSA